VTDPPEILLAHHLKTLKLPTFLREYEKLARHCAADPAFAHMGIVPDAPLTSASRWRVRRTGRPLLRP
jgi:hypothetical protein